MRVSLVDLAISAAVVLGTSAVCRAQSLLDSFEPPMPSMYDECGYSVSLARNGARAIVGTPSDDQHDTNAGAAYVLRRVGSTWLAEAKFVPTFGSKHVGFGRAVAASDGPCVIGTTFTNRAYVTEPTVGGWTPLVMLKPTQDFAGMQFGRSVATNGRHVCVGAPREGQLLAYGVVHVYEKFGGAWWEVASVISTPQAPGDTFGQAIAMDGRTLVVGATQEAAQQAGFVDVFEIGATGVNHVARLSVPGGQSYDMFGAAVAISGETIVVGAPGEDIGAIDSGCAHVFRRQGDQWSYAGRLAPTNGQDNGQCGTSVACSSTSVFVGAPLHDLVDPNGSVFVYSLDAPRPLALSSVLFSPDARRGMFGFALSVSGSIVCVGAPTQYAPLADAGHAYLFELL